MLPAVVAALVNYSVPEAEPKGQGQNWNRKNGENGENWENGENGKLKSNYLFTVLHFSVENFRHRILNLTDLTTRHPNPKLKPILSLIGE